MYWVLLKRLVRQFPKWAFVATLLMVSTALFSFWWFTRSGKKTARPQAAVEDVGPKLALIASKWDRLVLVDNDLYDLDSGQVVFRNWLQDGVPLRLFYDATAKKIVAEYERGFIHYSLDGREEVRLAQTNKAVFSNDLKWAVFAKEKEVWRADIDWQAFKFTNERKVTSIEQFNEANFADNVVLLAQQTLVVRNFNALLRVNLETGSVKPMRIPLNNIGKRRSPDGKWVVGVQGVQFYCYDVDADDAKRIPIGRNAMTDFQWLGNDKCLGLAAGKAVVLYDRLSHSLTEVAALPFSCFRLGDPSPAGRFVFAAGGIDGRNGALVDLEKKTAERVSGGAGIAWVSNDTFAFSREVPDSDLRGTWLQTAGQAERRVSPEPYLVTNGGAQLLVLPIPNLVVYVTHHQLTRMNSSGTGLSEMTALSRPPSRTLGIQKWKTGE
jgi:hypothetical protein